MTDTTLLLLLRRIRDGLATAEEFARAKELAEADPRIPESIRQGVLEDEPAAEAAGLLALLDADDGLLAELVAAVREEAGTPPVELDDAWSELGDALREAVRAESGAVDLASEVMAQLGHSALPVAEAVREEAGPFASVADEVVSRIEGAWISAMLDNELPLSERTEAARSLLVDHEARLQMTALADLGRDVRRAVAKEAGPPPAVWDAVAREIGIADPNEVRGWSEVPFAEAVRAEAGEVDVVDRVLSAVAAQAVAPPVQRLDEVDLPDPANTAAPSGGWRMLALLAAALLVAVLYRGEVWTGAEPMVEPEFEELAFAAPNEIVIEDLEFADDVMVFQAEGDEGALIIWIEDEEEVL